jgi:hypothetical protein
MAMKKRPKSKPAKTRKSTKKAVKRTAKRKTSRRRNRKAASRKPASARKKKVRRVNVSSGTAGFPSEEPDVESGDLQALPRIEEADSESVTELIEEGNALEADAVMGVEDADDADEREVHTHEVPEDDVPAEYLEKE